MKNSENPYPAITALGIKIYNKPIAYILSEDLNAVMSKKQRKLFSEYFGCQTCPLIGDKHGLYPWDVEAVLVRMNTGKLQGSQLLWD